MDLISLSDKSKLHSNSSDNYSDASYDSLHTESDKGTKDIIQKTPVPALEQPHMQVPTHDSNTPVIPAHDSHIPVPIHDSPTKMPIAHGGGSFYDTDTLLKKLANVERVTQRLLYDGQGLSDESEYDTGSTEHKHTMRGGRASNSEYSDDGKQTTSTGSKRSNSSSNRNQDTRSSSNSNRNQDARSSSNSNRNQDARASSNSNSNSRKGASSSVSQGSSSSHDGNSASSWASTDSLGRDSSTKGANNSSSRNSGARASNSSSRNSGSGRANSSNSTYSTSDAHSSDWPQPKQRGGDRSADQAYWPTSDNYFDTPVSNSNSNSNSRKKQTEDDYSEYASDLFTVSG
ncbi:Hypothetical protein MVR_LOCUS105 [uncultured virus]|nr:Hypothetical protein MVR_LOCUS105 [uncultured virus]